MSKRLAITENFATQIPGKVGGPQKGTNGSRLPAQKVFFLTDKRRSSGVIPRSGVHSTPSCSGGGHLTRPVSCIPLRLSRQPMPTRDPDLKTIAPTCCCIHNCIPPSSAGARCCSKTSTAAPKTMSWWSPIALAVNRRRATGQALDPSSPPRHVPVGGLASCSPPASLPGGMDSAIDGPGHASDRSLWPGAPRRISGVPGHTWNAAAISVLDSRRGARLRGHVARTDAAPASGPLVRCRNPCEQPAHRRHAHRGGCTAREDSRRLSWCRYDEVRAVGRRQRRAPAADPARRCHAPVDRPVAASQRARFVIQALHACRLSPRLTWSSSARARNGPAWKRWSRVSACAAASRSKVKYPGGITGLLCCGRHLRHAQPC